MAVLRVLFICTGNTCRSPMAQAVLRARSRELGWEGKLEVRSAGLSAAPGLPMSGHSAKVLSEAGIPDTGHESSTLDEDTAAWADLILTMTRGHRDALLTFLPELTDRTHVLCEYAGEAGGEIADPFGYDKEAYRACLKKLRQVMEEIIARLRTEYPDLEA